MLEFLNQFFVTTQFIPHGHCYLWQPGLVGLHIVSDLLIALAYYSISGMLVYLVHKRSDIPFQGIFFLFGAFIIACGTTHVIEVWTLWYPTYWLSGSIKIITAIISLYTALELGSLLPKVLALPSPAQLDTANQALAHEVSDRKQAQEALQSLNIELEQRVNQRTAELIHSNQELASEIAERKRTEDALRESEQRYRFLADAMPQIVWTGQPDGGLDYYNQRWYDYTGMTFEQTKDWGWQPVLHPDDLQQCLERWTKAVHTGEIYETEYRFKKGEDGTYRWHLGRALPMKDSAGKIVLWAGTCTDIDDQKRTEDQIKISLKDKEVLLKEIHHRVKNNLQIISSLLNLQSGYIKDEQTLEILHQCENRVASMALIHEQLYQSTDLARIDFSNYIQNLAANLFSSYAFRADAITLKVNVDNVFLGVDAAVPCGLIINELVSNSLKYAFPSGKEGEIRIEIHAEKGSHLVLSVCDNGIGFPKDLDIKNTESLGLQIVTALTNQLAGTIELNRNKGTEFKIKF
jgi:PAS domain S-box-containing protein